MSLSSMEDCVTPFAPQEDLYHEHTHLEKENDSDKVEKWYQILTRLPNYSIGLHSFRCRPVWSHSFICSYLLDNCFSSLQSLSRIWLFGIPWTAAHQASLSITNSWSLIKLMSIESVMPSNHLILCRPLLLPSIFPSIRVFCNKSVLHIMWPKYWSFSFSISPSNEYSGLISFTIDWFDLLAVKGTCKSLLQHHNSKASILRCSAFFTVQLSHPYMTTRKTIVLIIRHMA